MIPAEINSLYHNLQVKRDPRKSHYIFDSNKQRTYRIKKVIEKENKYKVNLINSRRDTPTVIVNKIPRGEDRWYFVSQSNHL